MSDRDAPGFIHWRLTGIPPGTTAIAQGHAPPGAVQGANGFGTHGYGGPCPPRGAAPHHYVIVVYARMGKRKIAAGQLIGTYARR